MIPATKNSFVVPKSSNAIEISAAKASFLLALLKEEFEAVPKYQTALPSDGQAFSTTATSAANPGLFEWALGGFVAPPVLLVG